MKKIEYRGMTFQYDDSEFGKWSFQRKLSDARGSKSVFIAADALFGDADAVAAKLGDDAETMAGLVQACIADMGEPEKN